MWWLTSPKSNPNGPTLKEPGPQFERSNLLREGEDLKRDFGNPSCCARLIAWRFTLLLLCNAVFILVILGVQNRSALPSSVQNFINQTRSSLAPAPPRQPRPKSQEPAPATPVPPAAAPPPPPAPPTPPPPPAPPAPPARMAPTKPLTQLSPDSPDPSQVSNATESSKPWVVYRFATRAPKICIQSTPPVHWKRGGRMQKVLDVRREYARRHGYDYYSIALGGGNPMLTWTRSLQLLMDANTGCEYIFRMDSETLIVDFEFKLETLIHWKGMRDTDLVVAGTGITGALVTFTSCLWKTSPFSRRLLAELRHYMASSEPKATAAASMNAILGGCTERSTAGERKNCVKKVSKQEEALQREAVQTGNNTGGGTGYRLLFQKKNEESWLFYAVSVCVPIVHLIFVNVSVHIYLKGQHRFEWIELSRHSSACRDCRDSGQQELAGAYEVASNASSLP